MKRQNKYKIALRSRPGINFTTSTGRTGSGFIWKCLTGLVFLILIPLGFIIALQFLQHKILIMNALLFVPYGPLPYCSALILVLLSGIAGISVINRRNYLHPVFLWTGLLLILISQTFFVRVTADGIRCRQLIWEKLYRWPAVQNAEIGVTVLADYPQLDYRVFMKDGREIALNPRCYYSQTMGDLKAVDTLLSKQQVLITVKAGDRPIPARIGIDAKKMILSHLTVSQ